MRPALFLSLVLALTACGSSESGGGAGDGASDGSADGSADGQTGGDGSEQDGATEDGASDGSSGDGSTDMPGREEPFVRRPLTFEGLAISYSPYRDGQSPARETPGGGGGPSDEQILEDLQILSRKWRNFRTYSSGDVTENVIRVLAAHKDELNMKVQLGAWLEPETDDAAKQRNEDEVARQIKMANEHPDIVAACTVANEVLVDWSTHKVPFDRVVYFVRKVRAAVKQPVSVAENYNWWRLFGTSLAVELDYVVIHTYPLWEKFDIDLMDAADTKAIDYTIANYDAVKTKLPDLPIVIGEAGWASLTSYNVQIVPGAGSEEKQKVYYEQLMAWSNENQITTFVFEAFDENWKGSTNPAETEKHWGLFNSNRTPKLVVKEEFSDLEPSKL